MLRFKKCSDFPSPMTIMRVSAGDCFGIGKYMAIPAEPNLVDRLKSSEFWEDAFPASIEHVGIDVRKVLLETDLNLVDVTASMARNEGVPSEIYILPSVGLEGRTSLHVNAIGTSQEHAESAFHEALTTFQDVVELEVRSELEGHYRTMFQANVRDFHERRVFFDRYFRIRGELTDVENLISKHARTGIFSSTVCQMNDITDYRLFSKNYHVRLVNRVQGNYQDRPVELAMIYMSGPNVMPGLYGLLVYTKHEKGCPAWETVICDQAESFAGFILTPEKFAFGGTVLRPEMAIPGHGGQYNFCQKAIQIPGVNVAAEKIPTLVDEVKTDVQISGQQVRDINALANLVYRNINYTLH